MNHDIMKQMYASLGISEEIYRYGEAVLDTLKERFENQLEKLHEKSKGDN